MKTFSTLTLQQQQPNSLNNFYFDIQVQGNDGLLVTAIQELNIENVKTLLNNNVNPNVQINRSNDTSLILAITQEKLYIDIPSIEKVEEITKILLENNANPNVKDLYDNTPLILAVDQRASGIVEILINAGADPYVKDNNGMSLLDIALETDDKKTVKILLPYLNKDGTYNINPSDYDNLSDDNLSDDNLSDDNLSDDNLSDDNLSDDNLSDDNLSDDNLSDDNLSDDNLSDDNLSDDNLSDDNLSDDNLSGDAGFGYQIDSYHDLG
ncbi:MAG: ankyrin repeat domain-containing protein [Rickettsiaceae bacterium]|nr:ankyrin repeat domain-containing protein [Rickettsiaceae bacterium]